MSNYNSLKSTINANIKQNGVQAITGNLLNSVLNAMVTTLGAGYQFAGVATTATNPGSPDAKVFYIANGKGTYTNFGGIDVTEDEVVVLYWDSSWHKVSTGIASQEALSELSSIVLGADPVVVLQDYTGGYTTWASGGITSAFKSTREIPANALIKSVTLNTTGAALFGGVVFLVDENNVILFKASFDRSIEGEQTVDINFRHTGKSFLVVGAGGVKFNSSSYPVTDPFSDGFYEANSTTGFLTKEVGDTIPFTNSSSRSLVVNASLEMEVGGNVGLVDSKQDKLTPSSILGYINNDPFHFGDHISTDDTTDEEYGNYNSVATNRQGVLNSIMTPCKKAIKGGKITSVYLKSESAGKVKVYVGSVDQLYLFVARREYEINVQSGDQTIDVSSLNIYINEGETLALQTNGARYLNTIAGEPEGDSSFYYGDTNNPFQLQVYGASRAVVFAFGYIIESNTTNQLESRIVECEDRIKSLEISVGELQSQQNVVGDSSGNKYKMVVSDGAIVLRALNFKHMLCVGNSYTTHPTTTDTESDYRNNLWWGHRAMASSSQSIAWTTLLQSILRTKRADAVVTPIFGRRYETNPSTYNLYNANTFQYWSGSAWTSLANNLASFADVDAVFFFLGDNYGGDDWYSLYKPMVEKFMQWFPNATIFCGSCNQSSKVGNNNAIAQTAGETGATYVNMVSIGGASKMGNFVLDDANTLHQINNQAVANHIGDLGQYLMLERICPAIGYNNNVTLYDVAINGNATTKDSKYISGAIVSIFLGSGATSASVVDADGNTITATDRGATDYGHIVTFTMPSSDVMITIA